MAFMFQTSSFFFGAGLTALLILAGISIGLWLGHRVVGPPKGDESERVLSLLANLMRWTDGVADDVSDYQKTVSGVLQRIEHSDRSGADPDERTASGLLTALVDANDLVRQRLESAESKLKQQAREITAYMSEARTDALTGLPNRRAFDDELNRRMAEHRRHGTPISVWLGDIDHFKVFNDRYGHLAGDAVLKEVARLLKDATRESDMVSRFGGEEFAMILPFTETESARDVTERIRRTVEEATFQFEGQTLRVTISCGVSHATAEDSAPALIQRADHALYASKNAGRNFAHAHDGAACFPLTDLTAAGPSSSSDPGPEHSTSLNEACDSLRERLNELVSQA